MYVHLHAHTSIGSMQDAMCSVDVMFKKAKEFGHPAMAITDHGTMAAMYDAAKSSKKHGVKFIPGCEVYFVDELVDKTPRYHLVLLAKNEIGYRNLLQINYLGFKNYQFIPILNKVFPRVDWSIIEKHKEGIICLSACGSGPISRDLLYHDENNVWDKEEGFARACKKAIRLREIFGDDFYLEVQPHDTVVYKTERKTGDFVLNKNGEKVVVVNQPYVNSKLLQMSFELGINAVAACDVHYISKSDADAHDMLMAINEKKSVYDKTRHRYDQKEFYFKDKKDVFDYFLNNFNNSVAKKVCDETLRIAEKCESSSYIDKEEIRFPAFDPKKESDYGVFKKWTVGKNCENIKEDYAYLRYKCVELFNKRFGHLSGDERKQYVERIKEEIDVLEERNFSSYILITYDMINKAKQMGVRVGPGRGSVGGSLVAFLLGIHEANPFEYGLIFERFINREKASFPDIDSDFSSDKRDLVEHYLVERYGVDNIARVSNLSRITPKVVIKDIARSLEIGGGKSEAFKIANEITDFVSDAETFDDAFVESKQLREMCAKYPKLEEYGRKLVGLEKTFSIHAAGVIVSDINLSTYAPLRVDKDNLISIQYEKERCEKIGLIKMDLLGLEHLKIITDTIENSKSIGVNCPNPEDLVPFQDKDVWDMISSGKTVCVFQVSSPHMSELCKKIKPRSIEDLSLVNALGRPSAVDTREVYIARRNGTAKIEYRHSFYKQAFEETLGICVYEEQLAKFAKFAAGWNLNKADGLRKLTKLKGKNPELARKLEEDFVNDCSNLHKLSKEEAQHIWKTAIEPFAGYGFNKAHAIFYSLNGYHTAYYKKHYPAAFMAAVLSSKSEKNSADGKEKIKSFKKEAKRMGVKIDVPDVNLSNKFYVVKDKDSILTGFLAIKRVGVKAIENIIETRAEHKFVSFSDFLHRTKSNLVRKDIIQQLAKAGVFDCFGITRKFAFEKYEIVRKKAAAQMKKYPDANAWDVLKDFDSQCVDAGMFDGKDEWTKKEILAFEAEVIGEYISGTINDMYDGFFTNTGVRFSRIKKLSNGSPIKVEAIIEKISNNKVKSGKNKGADFANCSLVDVDGNTITMTVWPDKWKKVSGVLVEGKPMRAGCTINIFRDSYSLILNDIFSI